MKVSAEDLIAAASLGSLYSRLRVTTEDPGVGCDIRYPASKADPSFHVTWTQAGERRSVTYTLSGIELIRNSMVDGASVAVDLVIGAVEAEVARVKASALH